MPRLFMTRDLFTASLVAILMLMALLVTFFAYRHVQLTRELSGLQAQMNMVQRNQNAVQALAKEATEYSKRNPAIDPLLIEFGVKPKLAQAPAPGTSKPISK